MSLDILLLLKRRSQKENKLFKSLPALSGGESLVVGKSHVVRSIKQTGPLPLLQYPISVKGYEIFQRKGHSKERGFNFTKSHSETPSASVLVGKANRPSNSSTPIHLGGVGLGEAYPTPATQSAHAHALFESQIMCLHRRRASSRRKMNDRLLRRRPLLVALAKKCINTHKQNTAEKIVCGTHLFIKIVKKSLSLNFMRRAVRNATPLIELKNEPGQAKSSRRRKPKVVPLPSHRGIKLAIN